MESWTEDVLLWASGKGAVGRGREPGRALFEGGNRTAAVAILCERAMTVNLECS